MYMSERIILLFHTFLQELDNWETTLSYFCVLQSADMASVTSSGQPAGSGGCHGHRRQESNVSMYAMTGLYSGSASEDGEEEDDDISQRVPPHKHQATASPPFSEPSTNTHTLDRWAQYVLKLTIFLRVHCHAVTATSPGVLCLPSYCRSYRHPQSSRTVVSWLVGLLASNNSLT